MDEDFDARFCNLVGKRQIIDWRRKKIKEGNIVKQVDTLSEITIKTFLDEDD